MGKEAAAGARSNEKERGERGIEVEGARTRRKIDREKSRHSVVAAEQQPLLGRTGFLLALWLLPFFSFALARLCLLACSSRRLLAGQASELTALRWWHFSYFPLLIVLCV